MIKCNKKNIMTIENRQKYHAGDKVKDRWSSIWTIVKRHGIDAPIRYENEEGDNIINQIDIIKKVN